MGHPCSLKFSASGRQQGRTLSLNSQGSLLLSQSMCGPEADMPGVGAARCPWPATCLALLFGGPCSDRFCASQKGLWPLQSHVCTWPCCPGRKA